MVQVQVEDDIELVADLPSKYKVFPDPLRAAIEKSYASAAQSQMRALATNMISRHKHTYNVVTESNGKNKTNIRVGFLTLSQSNTFLLTAMLKKYKDKIVPTSKFVRQERSGIPNPKFCHLHSLRHGEMVWGFDANGCLSMHVPYIEKDEKYEYNIYVERMVLKVEDKAT